MIFYINIFILIAGIILCIFGFTSIYKKHQRNEAIIKENEILEETKENLKQTTASLLTEIENKNQELLRINNQLSSMEDNVKEAFKNFCEMLDKKYSEKENEYDTLENSLQKHYDLLQNDIVSNLQNEKNELEKVRQTRAAAIEAQRKEKEIESDLLFYCVTPTEEELDDIQVLNRIKPKLHQPRILCMLVWSTYYQKPMTTLCKNILGTSVITGIYKITNQLTKQCYIGQAVDVAARWKQHAKCGLGIDTPTSNKLYKSMLEDGLHNFSFELLEQCSRDQLNEKEKFYINLYQSNDYGFNGNKGVGQ